MSISTCKYHRLKKNVQQTFLSYDWIRVFLTWTVLLNCNRFCKSMSSLSSVVFINDDVPLALFNDIVIVQWFWLVDDSIEEICNEHWRNSRIRKRRWLVCWFDITMMNCVPTFENMEKIIGIIGILTCTTECI